VSFILKDNEVLLLKKSKGLFGQGKWTLPGARYCPMKSLRLAPSEKSLKRQDSSSGPQKK
jgi:hypothetical protein